MRVGGWIRWKNLCDYRDLETYSFVEWSGWRDLNPHSTLNPILKLSYVNSITSNSQFTFV